MRGSFLTRAASSLIDFVHASRTGRLSRVREAIRAAPTATSWLVFDAEAVTHVDATGFEALEQLTNDLRRDEVTLVVARLRTRMQEQLDAAGLTETIGREHFYPSVHAAVEACLRVPGTVKPNSRRAPRSHPGGRRFESG